eukprot:gb/GECG01000225.1/.p1 GENE.gb/GECG01000225.1/~~gb/GECG01000225.1/.p1  ORF type:complete len:102 (+),score=5.95 gb/GECG01000225.1/:1-306(+)
MRMRHEYTRTRWMLLKQQDLDVLSNVNIGEDTCGMHGGVTFIAFTRLEVATPQRRHVTLATECLDSWHFHRLHASDLVRFHWSLPHRCFCGHCLHRKEACL